MEPRISEEGGKERHKGGMRSVSVFFIDDELRDAFNSLRDEDPKLHKAISIAIGRLRLNPTLGKHISRGLIPRGYIKQYHIDNLWKYNLPGAWRLMYSLTGTKLEIVAILLEWLPHKEYEKRFGYL